MNRTKFMKRIGAVVMAIAMLCTSMISASAATVPDATIDTSKTASLELYKYDFTTANKDGKLEQNSYISTGQRMDAVEQALADYAIKGVEFTYLKVADIYQHTDNETEAGSTIHKNMVLYQMEKGDKTDALLTALGLAEADAYKSDDAALFFTSDVLIKALSDELVTNETSAKNALEEFVKNNGGTAMPETTETGYSKVADLPLGLYVCVETRVPEDVTDTTNPFLVSLPMTTIDGDEWNYDVVVYPKNETGMPTLEKTLREAKIDTGKHNSALDDIADGYAHTGTASDGDIIDYQIISTLPTITSDATALTTYTFVDTLSKGIEYNKNDVKIEWFKDAACSPENFVATWTEADSKFQVVYGTADNDATTMTISMTDTGLSEINSATSVYDPATEQIRRGYSDLTMRITYAATVNSSADTVYGDNGNPNEVVLTWKRTNTSYYDTLNDDCHVYVYGLDLLKQFSDDNGNFENVEFKIFNNTDGYYVKAELNEDEGVFYVVDQADAETVEGTTFVPTVSGKIIVKGLEDDEYIITEVKTDDGYTLLKEDIHVVITAQEDADVCPFCGEYGITATAAINGDDVGMIEDKGSASAIVPLTVMNTRGFDLPQTGESGTMLLTVTGTMIFCLSAAALIFSIAKRKKTDEE